ncbi:MAG TPA: rRNA maturation RNase YbeY [Pyrinomonadaceae bacterium]|nr:rRNA maturation RNase YbeY [Pyrinomonadaceae bacterium]
MIVNLQRKIKLEARGFAGFLSEAVAAVEEAEGGDAAVAFVSDRRMRQLNKLFRGKDGTTDVLSFPHEAEEFENADQRFLGDIVISAEQAARQAEENGLAFEAEIKQLILHGLLHLCGYDHESDGGEMDARELELRDKLGI